MTSGVPQAPIETIPTSPPHPDDVVRLWHDVRGALAALPGYFRSTLNVTGVMATDLHAFNASLSTAIEQEVVDLLNRLRENTWDRSGIWALYGFERQPQRFPDVILKTDAQGVAPAIIMGIELKGWYVLAKEGEPSYRFRVSPNVCTAFDLIAVYLWAFSNVISGTPLLYEPYVVGAKYAAEYRNWPWEYGMQSRTPGASRGLSRSAANQPYPLKSDLISDRAENDSGSNFGRFARTGTMDSFKANLDQRMQAGIPIRAWRQFLKVFTESQRTEALDNFINGLRRQRRHDPSAILELDRQIAQFKRLLEDMSRIFDPP